jgi:Tol biopolymer transport system component
VTHSLARTLALAGAILLLAPFTTGCSKATNSTGPVEGDATGVNLLVYRTDRSGTAGQFDIAIYDLDEGSYHSVANLNSTSDESEPCLSNDGALVTFSSDRPGGSGGSDIFVYDRGLAQIAAAPGLNSAANETCPRFAYDSVYLLFVRDSSGFGRVRRYDPTGDSLIGLPGLDTAGPHTDTAPAPDLHSHRVAFQTDRDGSWDIRVWNDGSGLATLPALAEAGADDVEPSLSADGRWLAFASNRAGGAGGFDVYLYDLVNSVFVDLPGLNTAGDERHPAINLAGTVLYLQARPTPSDHWNLYQYSITTHALTQPVGAPVDADRVQPYARVR